MSFSFARDSTGALKSAMGKTTIGKLPPRYSFMLNPHAEVRLSKCPKCQKVTHSRKFALLIHIDEWGPWVLGKTCRYCSRCELVMVQRAELEAELAHGLRQRAPQAIGNDYLVLGTIEKKIWREGLEGEAKPLAEMLEHVADFKHHYELNYKPGGWYRHSGTVENLAGARHSAKAPVDSLTGIVLANRRQSRCLPELQNTSIRRAR